MNDLLHFIFAYSFEKFLCKYEVPGPHVTSVCTTSVGNCNLYVFTGVKVATLAGLDASIPKSTNVNDGKIYVFSDPSSCAAFDVRVKLSSL